MPRVNIEPQGTPDRFQALHALIHAFPFVRCMVSTIRGLYFLAHWTKENVDHRNIQCNYINRLGPGLMARDNTITDLFHKSIWGSVEALLSGDPVRTMWS